MAVRTLAALACGASFLALTTAAAAQDHSHHPAPPTPQQAPPVDAHAGHDMAAPAHTMTSPLGPWPISRDASGTAWQPDLSEHGGVHSQVGDWTVMTHALLTLTWDRQNGPRGDEKTFVAGMLMGSARRDFADGSTLNLRGMLSPDPFMGEDGYPLLLAAGETADGVNPLIDRQHPHELVMELSASYARPLTDKDTVFAYIGLPGEPAFGPPAFMHRMSAMDGPEAPITHHWLDSTHITFGVTTLGWAHDRFKLEASAFRGREPDQDRWGIEAPELDSWSVRGSLNPTPAWALQVSYAQVTAPEQLEPDEDDRKWSASAIHTRRIGADGWWSSTLAWGRKINDHDESKDGWAFETAVHPNDRWTVFGRAERIETDELVPKAGGGHGDLYTVSKASVGAVRDWRLGEHTRLGLGALYSLNRVPGALEPLYGDNPDGAMVFMRLKID
ncbi:MAG: hypothetical protein EON91_08950 [Brevundimonas sp.]|uniref:hypothetical protein n=1 Tax=Brevundimonas sp. TaxID=1871086 RepID=UPI0011FE95DE|nr:hypothetical protein [Brevundimonas sp.]RZJ17543.1 MAG: hypothetical protein EON91_08950 [Brevundimonas sp.]